MSVTPSLQLDLFSGHGARHFLRHYWQKKPLLIRGALPDLAPALSRVELFDLAARDDVEARLVSEVSDGWTLTHGPIERAPTARKRWTLLVQGVNLYNSRMDALMRRFAFVPFHSLDDLMVSYAVDGGGVGPHFDSYDVFLIQAAGQRRWRISAQSDLALEPGLPLKILSSFRPDDEWLLEPGDMLYLPPHIAHEGVAVGECVTYSVGFRAPTFSELAREFLFTAGDRIEIPGRLVASGRQRCKRPAQIDDELVGSLSRHLTKLRFKSADLAHFAGLYFSEPKSQVYFSAPRRISRAVFCARAARRGLVLDLKTQMYYRGRTVFINGESEAVSGGLGALRKFADQRALSAAACARLDPEGRLAQTLHQWYLLGWISIGG